MNSQVQTALTLALIAAFSGTAAKLGFDASTWPIIAGAIVSVVFAFALAAWRVMLRSNNAIIKEAAKIIEPTGGEIVTTPEIANGPLKDVANVVSK